MPNAVRRSLVALALYALTLLPGAPVDALCLVCSCTVSVSPLSFGSYSPASSMALKMSGSSLVSCTTTVAITVTVMLSLSAGGGTYAQRLMTGPGSAKLKYNVYTDVGDTLVFGDGTGNTHMETGSIPLGIGSMAQGAYNFYGSIPPGNVAIPGNYNDSLTLTVNY